MRVQDLMSTDVQTIAASETAEAAWNLMRTNRIHHLVVVAEGKKPVGVLSDRDAGGARGAAVRRNRTVAELMTDRVVTVPPTTPVKKAASLMRGRGIGCLVVTSGRRVIGIVTVSDLLELLGRGADRGVQSTTRWTLKHRTPHRKQHRKPSSW
jgi:predicted transcriptional regulator